MEFLNQELWTKDHQRCFYVSYSVMQRW